MTAQQPPRPPEMDPRMQRVLTLLTLHKNARHKKKISELGFLMVNQTFSLVPYRHGVFWRWDGANATLENASGLVELDPNGPYGLWITKVIAHQILHGDSDQWLKIGGQPEEEMNAKAFRVTAADCAEAERKDWAEWSSSHAMLLTMKNASQQVRYGLWLDREEAFHDTDVALMEDLGDGYAHAITQIEGGKGGSSGGLLKKLLRPTKSGTALFFLALAIIAVLPSRMSATAPAEVVARDPVVITVPFDGVIERAAVEPNQSVKKGDLLVVMDSTALKNKSELTGNELEAAQIALDKTEREALEDPKKRTEINILRAQIQAKQTEKNYADELLSRAEIHADQDGIAIFPDANALRGKPARTGEQVMLLAKPNDSELSIRIPVDAMIEINKDIPASFFLNVTPLSSREAEVTSISYQPSPDSDGLLTYKLRAQFKDTTGLPRVGWTGTAKVYGDTSLLAFNVLRRPLIALRRKTGF